MGDDFSRGSSETTLPKTLAAFGKPDFRKVLDEELGEIAGDFPLEDLMDEGGWPDTDSLDISVSDVSDDPDSIIVTVQAFFTEMTRHSGCADLEDQAQPYKGNFTVTISKEEGTATIEVDDHEQIPDDEDDEDDDPDIYVDGETD